MAASPVPVIVICVAALGACFGAAFLAAAAPHEDRACTDGELRAERVFAIETSGEEGARSASYFVELGNAQARPQVFTLRFEAEGVQDARSGARATSLPGRQNMPFLLGTQSLGAGARPMTSEAIAQAIRLHCRSW